MVLISRIFTYIVPLVYIIVCLSWLLHPNWVYYSSALVLALLGITIYSIINQAGDIKSFLFEMIYPFFTQLISLAFVVFLPKNWLYVVMVIFFAILLFFILNESFDRNHPFLGKTVDFSFRLQIILIVSLVFFMSVIGYSFVLYLYWPIWLVSIFIILILSLLLLRLQGYDRKIEYFFVDSALIALTIELFFIFYYLPIDIYLKSLIVSFNLFIMFIYITNKYFYKITS